jgi:hypothetical protein
MNLEWITSPFAMYTAVALSLLASLVLYFDLRVEMAKERSQERKKQDASAALVRGMAGDLETVRHSMSTLAVRPPELAPANQPAGQGINLSKRGQVLRMHRRGESVATIAAALQTPRSEIELLLKVCELTNAQDLKAS